MNNVHPRLTMLNEEQKQEIHQYTMKLIATTGWHPTRTLDDTLTDVLAAARASLAP